MTNLPLMTCGHSIKHADFENGGCIQCQRIEMLEAYMNAPHSELAPWSDDNWCGIAAVTEIRYILRDMGIPTGKEKLKNYYETYGYFPLNAD